MAMPNFDADPTMLAGSTEFVAGLVFFGILLRIFQRYFVWKWPGLGPEKICDISVMVVSSVFAFIGCALSFSILLTVHRAEKHSVIHDRHPVVRHFMFFAAAYFAYDVLAMFERFVTTERVEGRKGTIHGFIADKPVIVFHHVVILVMILSIVINVKLGDYLFAVAILMETSTPFVSFRRILEVLEMKQSLIYAINGLTMAFVFFWCRIGNFFYIYYIYAKELDLSIMETVLAKVPVFCSFCTLVLISPQIYWWLLMIKGCIKYVFSCHKKKHG